jgi:hypothetical protein
MSKTDAEIVAVLMKTPLAPVIEVLRSGKFVSPDTSVRKGEIKLDKLSTFERAAFTASIVFIQANAQMMDSSEKGKPIDKSLLRENERNKRMLDVLLWANIHNHRPDLLPNVHFGIRKGFKLVQMPESNLESFYPSPGMPLVDIIFPQTMKNKGGASDE